MSKRPSRYLLSLLGTVTAALAVTAALQARPNADTIKIGSITILTGPSAQIGIETERLSRISTLLNVFLEFRIKGCKKRKRVFAGPLAALLLFGRGLVAQLLQQVMLIFELARYLINANADAVEERNASGILTQLLRHRFERGLRPGRRAAKLRNRVTNIFD